LGTERTSFLLPDHISISCSGGGGGGAGGIPIPGPPLPLSGAPGKGGGGRADGGGKVAISLLGAGGLANNDVMSTVATGV
jgi:hypothetical protein